MSNYPDNFKGTNMDARGNESASDTLDAIESIGDKLEAVLREMIAKYDFNLTGKDISDAVGAIHDIVEDLFEQDRQNLMELDGWRPSPRRPQPNFKSASELLFESFKPRQFTNPATHEVLEQIAEQNRIAAKSEI